MSALRVVMFGDVDAGKSTILGRLMLDCGCVPPARIEEMERSSERRGVPVEYSFLLDAFQIERDQAITLDSSRIWLKTPNREIVFVDAPGHRELIRNLVSGASEVDAAVLVVAADEGITAQTRRQALFLQWFGFTSVLVAINKLDLCAAPQARYEERAAEADAFLRGLGIVPLAIVPVAAREGANLARSGASTEWWHGRTLLAEIEALEAPLSNANAPLRMVVQDIYRRGSTRWIVGRIDCGRLSCGDALTFWPLRSTARVERIVRWPDEVESASAGAAIAIELDERIFVDRGAVATHEGSGPTLGHTLSASLLWLGEQPARAGTNLRMRLGTREIAVTVAAIDETFDPQDGCGRTAEEIVAGDVASVTLVARETIAADPALPASSISRFILLDGGRVVAGGKVRALASATRSAGATNVTATRSFVGRE
ncbi:MAG: GTP-binding protein, partial [Candidatus Baltobacteraceae bacterium]